MRNLTNDEKLAKYEAIYISRKVSAKKCLEKKAVATVAYKKFWDAKASEAEKNALTIALSKI